MPATPLIHRFGADHLLGLFLTAHFALICVIKFATGMPEQIAWMSHVGLLLAGAGLLFRSPLLISTAFVDVLVLHAIWLADCLADLLLHHRPLGVTAYLEHADLWAWIATAHHFYLAPLLLVLVYRQRACPIEALPAAAAVYLILTVISRAAFAPAANINYAWGVAAAQQLPLIDWGNRVNGSSYLLGLNAFVFLYMLLPTFLLGQRLASYAERRQRGKCASSIVLPS